MPQINALAPVYPPANAGFAGGPAWRVLRPDDTLSYASLAQGPLIEEGLMPANGLVLVAARGLACVCVRKETGVTSWTLSGRDIALLPRGAWIRLELESSASAVVCCLAQPELGGGGASLLPEAEGRLADPVLRAMLEAAEAAVSVGQPAQGSLRLLLQAIGCQLAEGGGSTRPQAPALLSGPIKTAILFMQRNLDRQIQIGDVAAAVGLSQSHLSREFRLRLGRSPHQHLIALRLSQAADLLKETSIPLADVALACGFCNQEHLTRLFKRCFSTTPARFRQIQRA